MNSARRIAREGGVAKCKIGDCGKPPEARGLCPTHYQRWRRHGDPNYRVPWWHNKTEGPTPGSAEEYASDLKAAANGGPRCACGVLLPCDPETCPKRRHADSYMRSGNQSSGLVTSRWGGES